MTQANAWLSGAAPRFYCPALAEVTAVGACCSLDEGETRHARKVLRLGRGAEIVLFDGRGGAARATLLANEGGEAVCQVEELVRVQRPAPTLTVATAIPKGAHADAMVNQLSQLGVDALVPLRTQRSVVDPRAAKLDRFARQAIVAAKQSRRLFVMAVQPAREIAEVLGDEAAVRLIASPGRDDALDIGAFAVQVRQAASVLVVIGPEGGLTEEEQATAVAAGFVPWVLGPHVLRIETAAVAAAAVIRWLGSRDLPLAA